MGEKYEISGSDGKVAGYANDRDLASRVSANIAKEKEKAWADEEATQRAIKENARREYRLEIEKEANRRYAQYLASERDRAEREIEERKRQRERESQEEDRKEQEYKERRELYKRAYKVSEWKAKASKWQKFVATISGKNRRFNKAYQDYINAKDNEEIRRHVEEMEKMFPTGESKSSKEGRRK